MYLRKFTLIRRATDNTMKTTLPFSETWPQFLATGIVTIASFTTGIGRTWTTPFLPKLLSDEYPLDVTNEEASYIAIIASPGNIVGGFIGAALIDRIGRKKTILFIAVPEIISFVMISLCYYSKGLLYVARFVGGVGEGATFAVVPLYVAEIAQKEIRGSLGIMVAMSTIAGMLFCNILGSYVSIPVSSVVILVFPLGLLLTFSRMPESPYYLLMRERTVDAEKSLQFLRGGKDICEEATALSCDVKRQMEESGNYSDIFTISANRKAFLLMVGARVAQQLTGTSAFNQYAQLLFKTASEALTPQMGASIFFSVQLIMTFLSSTLVDKWGRRPLLIFSAISVFATLLIQAIYFHLKEYLGVDVSIVDWFPLLMMTLYVMSVMLGLGPCVPIMCSEMFSARVKGKAISLLNVVFAGLTMATVKYYQSTADYFGLTVPYYTFAGCTLVGVVFFYFYLPETKGKSLEEIQQVLRNK